ncbi:MAG: efflux RND transporter periplasmic adaptor subunit, partial [Gaiellales bacterium]
SGGHARRVWTVEVMRVESGPLRDVATFSGQLDAEFSVVLKSEIDGVVEEVLFEEGHDVLQGALLIRLRDDSQRAALREAIALESLEEHENLRAQKLIRRDAVSQANRDEAVAELEVARARTARARVELERTQIRAPFDGVVGFRKVAPGDLVSDEDPLVSIDSIDRLQLSFALSEIALSIAKPGMKIEARVAPYPGERFPGEVFVVSPTIDPATRRVILKAWVPNEDHRLRPGLFADLDLEVGRRDAAIVVPESTVVFDQHGPFVWRVTEEDTVERIPIETGLRSGGNVEVTMGLQPGDTVVTSGTHKVGEGSKIAAAPRDLSGQARRAPKPGEAAGEGT